PSISTKRARTSISGRSRSTPTRRRSYSSCRSSPRRRRRTDVSPAFRRALSYVVPYWRRLALVAALSLVSTALSLVLPYLSTPLGDILARVNNDVGEIQRVAAESLLAWAGNVLFLVGSVGAMLWLDARLALVGVALVPASVWALRRVRAQLARRVKAVREASA